jgi:hypothetical protein
MTTVKSYHTLLNKPEIRQKYESLHREMYPSKQVEHITQQIDVRWGCKYEAVDVISERFAWCCPHDPDRRWQTTPVEVMMIRKMMSMGIRNHRQNQLDCITN